MHLPSFPRPTGASRGSVRDDAASAPSSYLLEINLPVPLQLSQPTCSGSGPVQPRPPHTSCALPQQTASHVHPTPLHSGQSISNPAVDADCPMPPSLAASGFCSSIVVTLLCPRPAGHFARSASQADNSAPLVFVGDANSPPIDDREINGRSIWSHCLNNNLPPSIVRDEYLPLIPAGLCRTAILAAIEPSREFHAYPKVSPPNPALQARPHVMMPRL